MRPSLPVAARPPRPRCEGALPTVAPTAHERHALGAAEGQLRRKLGRTTPKGPTANGHCWEMAPSASRRRQAAGRSASRREVLVPVRGVPVIQASRRARFMAEAVNRCWSEVLACPRYRLCRRPKALMP